MARIPKEEVDRLNDDIDLVAFIGQWVELSKAGSEHKGLSPFTSEKSPSFFVNPHKGKWFDFSSGKNGNAVDFVMHHERKTFREAVRTVSEFMGRDLSIYLDNALSEADQKAFKARTAALTGMKDAQATFTRLLIDREIGLEYRKFAKKRGLTVELIREYGIGAAPPSYPLPDSAKASDCGLWVTVEGRQSYLRFRDRLMFPVRNNYGDIVTFAGRALNTEPSPKGVKAAKYLNGPETALFHKTGVLYGLHEANRRMGKPGKLPELLLVEGYLDVISLSAEGLDAAAPMGASLSEAQIKLAARYAEILYLCTDGDAGGQRGERRTLERTLPLLGELGAEVRVVQMPPGVDPDVLVRQQGGAAMRQLMERARTAVECAVDWVIGPEWPTLRPEAKAQQFNDNAEMIAGIRDPIMRDSAVQLLEAKSGFSAAAIRAKLDAITEHKAEQEAKRAANQSPPDAAQGATAPPPKAPTPKQVSAPSAQQRPSSGGAQALMDALGTGEPEESAPDQAAPVVAPGAASSIRDAMRRVYLSGQSVGAAGQEITRADMLRRSPPLRAAQLLLCYERLDIPQHQRSFIASGDLSMIRAGVILQSVAQEVMSGGDVLVDRVAEKLPDDGHRALLYYLLEERPHLPPAAAASAFVGLVDHCQTLVRDTRLAEIMSISEQRQLTQAELAVLQSLLPTVKQHHTEHVDALNSRGPGL